MERGLFIVNDTDTARKLLREAGSLAAGVGAELVLLNLADSKEYESDVRRTAQSGSDIPRAKEVEAEKREEAERLAEAELSDVDVQFEAVGLIGDVPDAVLEEARDRDCDHVFITSEKRSPVGKVIFGDDAQSVLLNFDGPVTVEVGEP